MRHAALTVASFTPAPRAPRLSNCVTRRNSFLYAIPRDTICGDKRVKRERSSSPYFRVHANIPLSLSLSFSRRVIVRALIKYVASSALFHGTFKIRGAFFRVFVKYKRDPIAIIRSSRALRKPLKRAVQSRFDPGIFQTLQPSINCFYRGSPSRGG